MRCREPAAPVVALPFCVDAVQQKRKSASVCVLHGLFGAGVSFAEHSSKADQYCTAGADGLYAVLLSRRRCRRVAAPSTAASSGRSTRTDTASSHVYDHTRTLPEYLLQYRRVR